MEVAGVIENKAQLQTNVGFEVEAQFRKNMHVF